MNGAEDLIDRIEGNCAILYGGMTVELEEIALIRRGEMMN